MCQARCSFFFPFFLFFLTLLLSPTACCRTPRCVNGTRLCVSERRRGVEDEEEVERNRRPSCVYVCMYMHIRRVYTLGRSIIPVSRSRQVPIADLLHRSSPHSVPSSGMRARESVDTHATLLLGLLFSLEIGECSLRCFLRRQNFRYNSICIFMRPPNYVCRKHIH